MLEVKVIEASGGSPAEVIVPMVMDIISGDKEAAQRIVGRKKCDALPG